jgi:hypothetical protein
VVYRLSEQMSTVSADGKSSATVPAASKAAGDALSRELTGVLAPSLLTPLLGIVAGYAREANWSRAMVEALRITPIPSEPFALCVDADRARVLFTELHARCVRAVPIRELMRQPDDPDGRAASVQIAGKLSQKECLTGPIALAVEPLTRWPDSAAAASVVPAVCDELLNGQVGAGALWIIDEGTHRIVRIDEKAGTACGGGAEHGAGHFSVRRRSRPFRPLQLSERHRVGHCQ